MRRLTIALLTLIVSFSVSFGQSDHLEPAKDFSKYDSITGGILYNYYNPLFDILLADLSKTPLARYLVLPSFTAEYVLSIEKDTNEKYKLTTHICSDNFWYSKDKKAITIKTKEKTIEADFAIKIKELFDKFTGQIKEPPTNNSARVDGTSYYFTTTNSSGQLITGKTWSPDKGTNMRKLVQICEDIYYFTNAKTSNSATIVADINKILGDL